MFGVLLDVEHYGRICSLAPEKVRDQALMQSEIRRDPEFGEVKFDELCQLLARQDRDAQQPELTDEQLLEHWTNLPVTSTKTETASTDSLWPGSAAGWSALT